MFRILIAAACAAGLSASLAQPAAAQGSDFFIPGQSRQGAAPAPAAPRAAPRPAQVRPGPSRPIGAAPQGDVGQDAGAAQAEAVEPQVSLPPLAELPALPKGEAPPTAVIGVMGVPEVMRAAAAAQQVEKVIGERRQKLNDDATKEQAAWRDMQQALANDRAKLSPDQIRARERELQDRVTNAQKSFRDRNRIIQEAAQYSLAQIERMLIAVIRQVADSRGMNLVLHRQQVALNIAQFDITDDVAVQMNKIMPTVLIPPDGVSPADFVKSQGAKAGSIAQSSAPGAPAPTTASAPAPASVPAVPSPVRR